MDDVEAARRARWEALFAAVGGRKMIRNGCNVSDTTLWRWVAGNTRPSRVTRGWLDAMCGTHGLAPIYGVEEKGTTNASTK